MKNSSHRDEYPAMQSNGPLPQVVFITNHSHDDSGDMYVGPNLCVSTKYVGITIWPLL